MNSEERTMRGNFNRELIEGLYKCRNRYPEVRPWLRQCIALERRRRGKVS